MLHVSLPCDSIDVDACYRYVLTRQTVEGGFCFYACHEWGVEEPNALDTYAAVIILGLLGQPVPQIEKCKAWLQAQQDSADGYQTLVIGHAILKTLRTIGAEPVHDPRPFIREIAQAAGFTDPSGLQASGWLRNALRCADLFREFGIALTEPMCRTMAAALGRLSGDDGGFGVPGTNLLDTGVAVELAAGLSLPVSPKALDYARRCEGSPFGFNLTPSAVTSNLEVQRAGLKVLDYFGTSPHDQVLIRSYVASCQRADGGFGRAVGAITGLVESMWALEVLSMLAHREPLWKQPARE